MSFPEYCPPALQEEIRLTKKPKSILVKSEKTVDKITPVKVVCAGKKVDKNPYREMKERMEAAEKLVDEMSNKEEAYKTAAKEALRQLLNLRSRLNDTIAWVRSHCIQGENLKKPRAEPIVIEDVPVEEKSVDKNEELFADEPMEEKSVDKNANKEVFVEDLPEEKGYEYKCIETLKMMMEAAKGEYANDPCGCTTFDFIMEYDDDLWKVSFYMEHGPSKSHDEIDKYFAESKPGWLNGSYKTFWDFYQAFTNAYYKCLHEKYQPGKESQEQAFDDDDFLPFETQV